MSANFCSYDCGLFVYEYIKAIERGGPNDRYTRGEVNDGVSSRALCKAAGGGLSLRTHQLYRLSLNGTTPMPQPKKHDKKSNLRNSEGYI